MSHFIFLLISYYQIQIQIQQQQEQQQQQQKFKFEFSNVSNDETFFHNRHVDVGGVGVVVVGGGCDCRVSGETYSYWCDWSGIVLIQDVGFFL